MDLRAFCELDYDAALAVVEKTAAEKAADGPGLIDQVGQSLRRAGTGVRDFADKHLGAAARGAATDGVKGWWERTQNDPARLALLGAGVGAGAGGLGSLVFGRPGRKRPLQGALLGGLMGAAGAGAVGYSRHLMRENRKAPDNLNAAKANLDGAQQNLSIEEQSGTPLGLPKAIGRGVTRATSQFTNNDIPGGMQTLGNTARRADVIGLGEVFDQSGSNDSLAPTSFVNDATRRAVDWLPNRTFDAPAERQALQEYLQLPTVNPAAESVAGLGVLDARMSSRANSLYNPRFLREAIGTTTKLPSHLPAGDLAAIRQAVLDAPDRLGVRSLIPTPGRMTDPVGTQDLRSALGGRFGSRLSRTLGLGGLGDGLVVRPGVPAVEGVPSMTLPNPGPGGPVTIPGQAAAPASPPLTVSRAQLESIAREGRQKILAESGDARGFLRSGFGSAAGGRLGGIGLPRWMMYPAVPTAIHWTRGREQGLAAARQQVDAARAGVADAQSKMPQPRTPAPPH